MELFKKYTDVIKGKSRLLKVMKDVWTPQMMVQQYIIGVNKRDKDGNTILHEICKTGDDKMMEKYLHLPGIDINATNNCGSTALMCASKNIKGKCMDILRKIENMEINAKDNFGRTALMYASLFGNEKGVEILCKMVNIEIYGDSHKLRYGISHIEINAKNINGLTALMYASEYSRNNKCVGILCKTGKCVETQRKTVICNNMFTMLLYIFIFIFSAIKCVLTIYFS